MPIQLKPLPEQVIVITGASSGIGLATAEAALAQGAKVVIAARSKRTLKELAQSLSGEIEQVVADVGLREDVENIAAAAIKKFGRIDTWVNNAGVSIYGRLDEVSEEDSKRLFDTNYWGVVNGSIVAMRYLKTFGGALINVGSEVSEGIVPLQGMCSASKYAVKGFTDALRLEVQLVDKAPVSITLIQPSAVNTPYAQHAKHYMRQEPGLPLPLIDPRKVANAILDAAVNERREVKVRLMAPVSFAIDKVGPKLREKMSATPVSREQQHELSSNPDGTLYQAGGTGEIYGSGPVNSK